MAGYRRLLLVLALVLPWSPDPTQTLKPTSPFSVWVAQWTRILDEADWIAQTPGISPDQIEEYRRLPGGVRAEAQNARQAAETRVKAIDPPPNMFGIPPPTADRNPRTSPPSDGNTRTIPAITGRG